MKLKHLFIGFFVCLSSALAADSKSTTKKLIEFGWDEPSPAFMREHIVEMEKTPFDGCVFHVDYTKPDKSVGNFTWDVWGTHAFTAADLAPALVDLKSTKFRRFKQNFLRFNVMPGPVDWFDDFSAILNNAQLAAHVAHDGKCKGLLFDIEQYGERERPFDYRKQRDAAKKSWDEYAAQTRRRGREVMEAFQKGYPDLTVFLTFGYSLPRQMTGGKKEALPTVDYGLLSPFIDGLFEGAKGKTKIVDGYEISYGYKEAEQFSKAYTKTKEMLLPMIADPKQYQKHFSMGFGIWMDNNSANLGWSTNDFSKNYFTPEVFATSVRSALANADEYVWIYTERLKWWSKDGKPEKLPAEYDAVLRGARKK
jgi:hypothetical protein